MNRFSPQRRRDAEGRRARTITATLVAIVFIAFGMTAKAQRVDTTQLASNVKTEFMHAWTGYKKYCWGHDDLKPLSKTCRDWYGQPILMTAVDSLDSLYLLGFKKEADDTRE